MNGTKYVGYIGNKNQTVHYLIEDDQESLFTLCGKGNGLAVILRDGTEVNCPHCLKKSPPQENPEPKTQTEPRSPFTVTRMIETEQYKIACRVVDMVERSGTLWFVDKYREIVNWSADVLSGKFFHLTPETQNRLQNEASEFGNSIFWSDFPALLDEWILRLRGSHVSEDDLIEAARLLVLVEEYPDECPSGEIMSRWVDWSERVRDFWSNSSEEWSSDWGTWGEIFDNQFDELREMDEDDRSEFLSYYRDEDDPGDVDPSPVDYSDVINKRTREEERFDYYDSIDDDRYSRTGRYS